MGITADTRINIKAIYDFKTGCVKTECLRNGWITSGSAKVIRMAFNLYNNGMPSVYDYDDVEEQLKECRLYMVEDLFCCGYGLNYQKTGNELMSFDKLRHYKYQCKKQMIPCS